MSDLPPRSTASNVLIIALVLLVSISCARERSDYSLRSGLIELRSDGGRPELVLAKETNEVSRTEQETISIGFAIASSTPREFEVRTVHYLPGIPEHLGGQLSGKQREAATEGLRSDPVVVKGAQFFPYEVGPGDPFGTYRIEVYVNGKFFRELRFEVVERQPQGS